MKIIILGPPGAGKGTQAEFISAHWNIPIVSAGNMLRQSIQQKDCFSERIQSFMQKGQLVPDELIIHFICNRITQPDCTDGFLLDGFPRTVEQAEALRATGIPIDCVLNLTASDDAIIERMNGRLIHPGSGRVYHIRNNPPRTAGCDDQTGEPLVSRSDDTETIVRQRLHIYQEKTVPLINYYRTWLQKDHHAPQCLHISGEGSVEQVQNRITDALGTVFRRKTTASNIVALTNQTFSELIARHDLVLIDFWTQKCAPCLAFSKIIQRIAPQYPEVLFGSVHIEEEWQLSEDFQILSVPTVLILKQQVVVYADSGTLTAETVCELLEKAKNVQLSDQTKF